MFGDEVSLIRQSPWYRPAPRPELQTEPCNVGITLGGAQFILRCGALPALLGAALMMAGTMRIVGTQVLRNRPVGYFPRCRLLAL